MKLPGLLLGFVLASSLGIAGYIHMKRKQELQLNKLASFQDIKLRVTRDVLGEYQDQISQGASLIDDTKREVEEFTKQVSEAKKNLETKKFSADACKGDKKRLTLEVGVTNSEKTNIRKQFEKEKSRWEKESTLLKNQAGLQSSLCKYINMNSEEGKKLCGIKNPAENKPEGAKVEVQ